MRIVMRMPAGSQVFVFFAVMLVLAGCCITGCSTRQPAPLTDETQNATNPGFRVLQPESVSAESPALGFKDVTAQLAGVVLDRGNRSAVNATIGKQILYVRGNNLNDSGQARSWIVVVRQNNRTSVVTFDQQGITVAAWNGEFRQKEIPLDSIILPEELFLKNRAAITGDNRTGSRDLVLSMDRYTVTTSGTMNRILVFDAKTGALMSSHG